MRPLPHRLLATSTMLLLAGCMTGARAPAVPTATVLPEAETIAVGTRNADAADDPAIYAAHGAPAMILGTDKKAGLYVFDLAGEQRQFLPEGLLNNVDLLALEDGFVAGASDRGRMGVALYRLARDGADDTAGRVVPAGFIDSDVGEPYGFCMGMFEGAPIAVLVGKSGDSRIYTLRSDASGGWTGSETARFALPSQSEGCVVDSDAATLYVGEEAAGVWRFALDDVANPALVAATGDGRLVADVEGVTLIEDADGKYLIVSSQGDSAFAVYRLGAGDPAYLGRFRIGAANGIDAVSGTDGISAHSAHPALGDYADGLVVVQDDVNEGNSQNFKLVRWTAVRAALASMQ